MQEFQNQLKQAIKNLYNIDFEPEISPAPDSIYRWPSGCDGHCSRWPWKGWLETDDGHRPVQQPHRGNPHEPHKAYLRPEGPFCPRRKPHGQGRVLEKVRPAAARFRRLCNSKVLQTKRLGGFFVYTRITKLTMENYSGGVKWLREGYKFRMYPHAMGMG